MDNKDPDLYQIRTRSLTLTCLLKTRLSPAIKIYRVVFWTPTWDLHDKIRIWIHIQTTYNSKVRTDTDMPDKSRTLSGIEQYKVLVRTWTWAYKNSDIYSRHFFLIKWTHQWRRHFFLIKWTHQWRLVIEFYKLLELVSEHGLWAREDNSKFKTAVVVFLVQDTLF